MQLCGKNYILNFAIIGLDFRTEEINSTAEMLTVRLTIYQTTRYLRVQPGVNPVGEFQPD